MLKKKIGVVSINLGNLQYSSGTAALSSSGNNFGNMLFTNAAYRQVRDTEFIGFGFDPYKVREQYGGILIPAANWVNAKEDWGWLADLLEKTNLPVIVIGLGAQLQSLNEVGTVPAGTVRFLKLVSRQSEKIGVRGNFTAQILKKLGIKNVEALGCPSIFYHGRIPVLRSGWEKCAERLAIGPTRYVLPETNQSNRYDKQRQLYQFAIRNASSIYYQSEAFEIALLNREKVDEQMDRAVRYYGFSCRNHLIQMILQKGKYHQNLEYWLNDMAKDDLYVGTRIHGAIAAILAGTPALLITHDNRTVELADLMGIPSLPVNEFEVAMLYDLPALTQSIDYQPFANKMASNLHLLKKFYQENGLETTL